MITTSRQASGDRDGWPCRELQRRKTIFRVGRIKVRSRRPTFVFDIVVGVGLEQRRWLTRFGGPAKSAIAQESIVASGR